MWISTVLDSEPPSGTKWGEGGGVTGGALMDAILNVLKHRLQRTHTYPENVFWDAFLLFVVNFALSYRNMVFVRITGF